VTAVAASAGLKARDQSGAYRQSKDRLFADDSGSHFNLLSIILGDVLLGLLPGVQ